MARPNDAWFAVTSLEGGFDGTTPPHALPPNMCVAATNVDWDGATLARKRNGCEAVSTANMNSGGTPAWIYRHVPGGDDTAAEVWAWNTGSTSVFWRVAGGTTWASVSLPDTLTACRVCGVSFNGKLFIAYDSTVDRLHAWDGSSLRRVGLAAPSAAPSIAESAGAATDVRKYRAVALHLSGSDTIRRSEPSAASSSITLTAERATATFGGAPSEGETHWELQVASDDDSFATWYVVGQATTATTIVDNNANIVSLNPAAEAGLYQTPPSARFLLVDENRLLLAGSFESTSATFSSRVWFTPVLGASDLGDDERYTNTSTLKGWVDIDRGAGGAITGMGGPLYGSPYVFKRRGIYKLVRTGSDVTPYQVVVITRAVGALAHRTITLAEDEEGNPCLYFLSERGPYRLGVRGLQYLGKPIEYLTAILTASFGTSTTHFTLYYPGRHQVWWWFNTDGSTTANRMAVYDIKRRAWSGNTGSIISAAHADLIPTTLGASMTLSLKPGLGMLAAAIAANTIYRADVGTDDAGTAFQAFVTSRAYTLSEIGAATTIAGAFLRAAAASGVTIQLGLIPDFDTTRTRTFTVSIAAAGSESRVTAALTDAELADVRAVQFTLGDAAAVSNNWILDALSLRAKSAGEGL